MASNDVEVLDPAAPVEKNTNTASGCELDRRHFITALGVAGAAAGTALMVSSKAQAQQPSNPNGYSQVDVLNLMLQIKYLKATLYSYITQGADLPASSYVTLGTGQVFNQPAKITFTNQQITDVFNEMYYDELQQLITLRSIQGAAVANRPTMNILGTGPSGTAPSTTTTTMTQAQAIGLARMLEDLSASAFATATIYLTGTNLAYAAQALATDGYHAGLIRLLSIQNNIPYVSTQYASVATSNTAQAAVTFNGSLTAGGAVIYSTLPTNLPAVGNVLTGTGIPPGAGAVITAVTSGANLSLTAILNSNTTLTNVSNVAGLLPGQPISGTSIPANTVITAVGTNTITLSNAASATTTVKPTGFVTTGSAVITGVSSTSGLIAGQVITGTGIPTSPATTIVSFSSSAATITMSAAATVTSSVSLTGTLTSGSPTITSISTNAGLVVGQPIAGTGIPSGATISSIGATSVTMSANATASSGTSSISFAGIVTNASATVSAVSSVAGLAVGQLIAGAGIAVGTTIKTVGTTTITLSANATASSTVTPTALTTAGSNILTSVSSVAGMIIGQSITGTGIPTGTTITAIGTTTVTMSANATATITIPETVTSPTTEPLLGGGQLFTTPTTEAVTSPTTSAITIGVTAITIAQPATATGIFPLYVILADNQDVQPGDPGTAALAAAGPAAIAGISPPIYQAFFNTAGAATSSANTPAGFAFARSFQQVLAVLYGYNSTNSVITTQSYQGGFFPFSVSGQITSAI